MRFFTQSLWRGFNSPRSKTAFRTFNRRFEVYAKQLEEIIPRLGSRAQHFFRDVSLHDGTLNRLEIGDRIDDPASKLKWSVSTGRRTAVRMFVLTRERDSLFTLKYKDVTRAELNFPGKVILFPVGMHTNFGDWGYDELTAISEESFRHEILFASGATIAIEFKEFNYRREYLNRQKPGDNKSR